jgi:hypothetical protein
MAGAVQTKIVVAGYSLDYAAATSGSGTVTVQTGIQDGYGFYSGDVTLAAAATGSKPLIDWTVNGVSQGTQAGTLTITMNEHKVVRAVFATIWTVDDSDSGNGSLRYAITNADAGDYIRLPAGKTIALTATLPQITKSLTIEGNGATLTRSGFTPSDTSQLFFINSTNAEVRISHLHFTGGRATNYGAAIRSAGAKLTLESCIFSYNNTTPANGSSTTAGGALLFTGQTSAVTISGCTFYQNTVTTTGSSSGGAIYRADGSLTLTGNLFCENTAKTYPVMFSNTSAPSAASNGYNISDYPGGTAATESGWIFSTSPADVLLANDVTFDGTYRPASASNGLPVIPSVPSGFPTTYFDGTSRGSNSTPGAMPKQ